MLMLCQHDSLKNIGTKYMKLFFMYCLLGVDKYILTYTFSWLRDRSFNYLSIILLINFLLYLYYMLQFLVIYVCFMYSHYGPRV